jgi:hypothetical protein
MLSLLNDPDFMQAVLDKRGFGEVFRKLRKKYERKEC